MERGNIDHYSRETFDRYLSVIGVKRSPPNRDHLEELTTAHLRRIPFENVSKIHRVRVRGIRTLPDLAEFLSGIEEYGFGGTCFTNNYFLHLLLGHLKYQVKLCGADIAVKGAPPDGHMVNVVTLDGKELIVDVGYGAPFWQPIPRGRSEDFVQQLGSFRYIFKPPDSLGQSRLEVYRGGQLAHGYLLKPKEKRIGDFTGVINRSYSDGAPFLNRLTVARFLENRALVLTNSTLTEMTPGGVKTKRLETRKDIAAEIMTNFNMPGSIVTAVLKTLEDNTLFGA